MAFHVGQKVVCVDVSDGDGDIFPLAKNGIYTVSSVGVGIATGAPVLRVAEFSPNLSSPFRGEFWASRFRPVVERKTDISIFKAMLTPNRVNA